jgi:Rrf2 family protein
MDRKFDKALQLLGVINQCPPHHPLTAQQLAESVGLSLSYVEALIRDLRVAGYLSSVRGPGGGYVAGPKLSQASAGDVYELFSADERDEAIDPTPLTPARASVHDIAEQLTELKFAFLKDFPLSELSGPAPQIHVAKRSFANGLKPVPELKAWLPDAPNSIFDLARFHVEKSGGARA